MENYKRAQDILAAWKSGPLVLQGMTLDTLPVIPEGVEYLDITFCELKEIPVGALPSSLKGLRTGYNCLRHLPPLPPTLETLNADCNELKELPPLPQSLCILSAETNFIDVCPLLPHGLRCLYLSENLLRSLPPLPATLVTLVLSDNMIKKLPVPLPARLQILEAHNNLLTELPESIGQHCVELVEVNVSGNRLDTLPTFYPNLTILFTEGNTGLEERGLEETIPAFVERIQRLEEKARRVRIRERCRVFAEEMMMKMWHPSRVERLMLAGVDMEDM